MSKKTIVFDFDGVIHLGYEGWKDGTIYGTINWRLLDYIEELLEDYYVVISTNRPAQQIVDYFENIKENIEPLKFEVFKKDMSDNMYWNKDNVIGVTNEKAVGILYIDDRGFRYDKDKDTYDNIYNINKILGRENTDILFQIDMQLYDEFNDTIATMNDHLGDIYSLRDVEEVEKAEKEKEIKLLREAVKKLQSDIEIKDKVIKELENKLEEHIKFCEQEAIGHIENNVCHISLKFEKRLLEEIKKVEEEKC